MADPYLDYLAGREADLDWRRAKLTEESIAVAVARRSYEAFLEAGIPVSKERGQEEARQGEDLAPGRDGPAVDLATAQPDLPTMLAGEDEAQPDPDFVRWAQERAAERAPREAQPADEPYDAGPMPAHLRRLA